MTIIFSGMFHNDSTTSTELTCDKAFSYAQEKQEKITSHPKQHSVRMSLFKSFIIQRMQAFRPKIELQKFRPYSNLSRACVFLQLDLKNFTSDARTCAETSARTQVLISP